MDLEIRNAYNLVIGWEKDLGSMIQAMGRTKGYLGFYNKGTDITFDKNGKIFCYGNGCQCLIRNEEK